MRIPQKFLSENKKGKVLEKLSACPTLVLLPPPFSVILSTVYFSPLPSLLFLFLYSVTGSSLFFSGSVMH